MLTRKYISLILLCALISSSANATHDPQPYITNMRHDRCVHVSIIIGAILTVALVTPGGYILTPNGAYNMQLSCPQNLAIQCCDPKGTGQNMTTGPNNCAPLPADAVVCVNPKVGYCDTTPAIPADLGYQDWAKRTGGALLAVGLVGFIYGIGGFVAGLCWGTFFCG